MTPYDTKGYVCLRLDCNESTGSALLLYCPNHAEAIECGHDECDNSSLPCGKPEADR